MNQQPSHQPLLSRTQCDVLRGIAIAGIALHNYCHWLGPIVKENEYTFSHHNVSVLNQVLAAPDLNLPVHLLSFFGHYGVPIFLFLSAYGLVLKYEQGHHQQANDHHQRTNDDLHTQKEARPLPSAWSFVVYHFAKLFKMMIVGFVAFTIVDAITPGRWHYTVTQILAQLSMTNNLLPDPDHQIWPGPYWFFGLMLQLYVVYRLVLAQRHWGFTVALMLICLLLQLGMAPEGDAINRYRYNFMGGMLPFGVGLLYARYGTHLALQRLTGWHWTAVAIVSMVLTYVFSLNFVLWALAPAVVCVGGVALAQSMARWQGRGGSTLVAWTAWLGQISAALFVCHPILRKVFIPISRNGDIYAGLLLYVVSSLCVAWLFRELMKKIPNPHLQ